MGQIIVVDIGNTFGKIAVAFDDGTVESVSRVSHSQMESSLLETILRHSNANGVIISCVGMELSSIERMLQGRGVRYIILSHKTKLPISIGYNTPATLGADRIATATGAFSLFPGESLMVVDFGTAITIDFITAQGEFSGGNISLGMRSRFESLHAMTHNLPMIEPPYIDASFGRNTREAITSGVILGIIFEIEGYISRFRPEKVIFTGGDALFFAKRMKSPIFVIYNLLFRGLIKISLFNE